MPIYLNSLDPSSQQSRLDDVEPGDLPVRPGLLIYDAELAERVIRRACDDVRRHPACTPLWGYRICQWINRGVFRYGEVWGRLHRAALAGGAPEDWVNRVLFRSFGDTLARRGEPMPLNILARGLH